MSYKLRMFRKDNNIMYGVFLKEWIEGTSRTQDERDDDIGGGYFKSGDNLAEFDSYDDAWDYREKLRDGDVMPAGYEDHTGYNG